MTDQTAAIDAVPGPGSLLHLRPDRGARFAGRDRDARHQHPAAVAAADGGLAEGFDGGGDVGDHGLPRGVRGRPAGGRADLGPFRPALAGVGRLRRVLCRQRLVRVGHRPAGALTGRVIQAAGACATSVLSRAIARDMFSGAALGRAMALIMIAMSAAPGFSPLLGGALDHVFGWRSEFVLVAIFAALGAVAYAAVFGETHHSTRTPLNPLAIAKNYAGLIGDRRFVVPAATVSLIMGGLFAVFSAAPRVLIEALKFSPIQLGLFFAGTVLIVFAAGMLATRLAPRYGFDRSIRGGLFRPRSAVSRSLLVSRFSPSFPPFLGTMSVFLLGMGIVSPLGTAQTLSPFGEKAGAASALLRLLADDECGDRGLAGGNTVARRAVRARRGADGVFAGGGRALYVSGASPLERDDVSSKSSSRCISLI